jgi:hypothetical protein
VIDTPASQTRSWCCAAPRTLYWTLSVTGSYCISALKASCQASHCALLSDDPFKLSTHRIATNIRTVLSKSYCQPENLVTYSVTLELKADKRDFTLAQTACRSRTHAPPPKYMRRQKHGGIFCILRTIHQRITTTCTGSLWVLRKRYC